MIKTLAHHRFSVDDYDRMIDTGILSDDVRCELIRGEILDKMPVGKSHGACVNRLSGLLSLTLGQSAIVSVQNPLPLADSAAEPDISVLRNRDDFYESSKPTAADAQLVIEVADTSLEYDRETKEPLYAEAGIADFWIVNLVDGCAEVYRQPQADGSFASVRTFSPARV